MRVSQKKQGKPYGLLFYPIDVRMCVLMRPSPILEDAHMECPSCGEPMIKRTHEPGWRPPKDKKYYYSFWYVCVEKRSRCRTSTICPIEARVHILREVKKTA